MRGDGPPAARAVRLPDRGVEEPQVVVDLGDRPDRGARVLRGGLLLDRDRRREPLDGVDVRLLHLLEELPGVRGERLHVAALSLGEERVERQRRLARAGQPREHHQLVARQVEVDVLEIVLARAADRDELAGGGCGNCCARPWRVDFVSHGNLSVGEVPALGPTSKSRRSTRRYKARRPAPAPARPSATNPVANVARTPRFV